jgi:hypothetical protein
MRFLLVREVADLLRRDESTVRKVKDGWLIPELDVQQLLDRDPYAPDGGMPNIST